MENQQHIIKINLPGGIVSPGDLYEILTIAEKHNVNSVRFGNRQQLLFTIDESALEDLKDGFLVADVDYELNQDKFANIVSSYVTEEVLYTSNWLREGVYKDILNDFSYKPELKINLVDYYQNLIPFFTGNLNFISSEKSNFWYLYIRFPKTNTMFCWPSLVYSEDIPLISKAIEKVILTEKSTFYNQENIDGNLLYEKINANNKYLNQPFDNPLVHTGFQLPYYEGFNKYGNNKLWLGIYRRNESFSIPFLKEICTLCLNTRIGQLYTTSWKSLVIKSINQDDRKYWSNLLNKHRINVRHAANELNWQLEDLCQEAIDIKLELVKNFEEADLRTYPLCFAIKTKPNTGLFGSVIIRKRNAVSKFGEALFEVLHTHNFNPNSKDFVTFAMSVSRQQLGETLIALCDYFYDLNVGESPEVQEKPKSKPSETLIYAHQCRHCLTIYDPEFGDPSQNIDAGTTFESLENYICPTCDAPKTDFVQVQIPQLVQ
jgi:rubredoxin